MAYWQACTRDRGEVKSRRWAKRSYLDRNGVTHTPPEVILNEVTKEETVEKLAVYVRKPKYEEMPEDGATKETRIEFKNAAANATVVQILGDGEMMTVLVDRKVKVIAKRPEEGFRIVYYEGRLVLARPEEKFEHVVVDGEMDGVEGVRAVEVRSSDDFELYVVTRVS